MSAAALRPGIDMIMLYARPGDYQIADYMRLGHTHKTKPGQKISDLPFLYRDTNGFEVHASGSEYSGKNANLSYTVKIDHRGLALQFNPSKIKNGRNSFLLVDDTKDIAKIGEAIKTDLNDSGIYLDFDGMKVSRLDLTKQDFTPRPFIEYHSALDMIPQPVRRKDSQFNDTYYLKDSTKCQLTFYDKGKAENNQAINGLIRAEERLLSNPIQKTMQIYSYSDFLKTDQDYWNAHYNAFFNRFIPFDPEGTFIKYETILSFFKSIQEKKARNYFNEFWRVEGLRHYLIHGCLDHVWKAAEEAGISRQAIDKEKKKVQPTIRQMIMEKRILQNKVTAAELIQELKQKFAA